MSIQTRSSDGIVEGVLGPVALQSFYSVAPSQAIGSRGAAMSKEEGASRLSELFDVEWNSSQCLI